MGDEEWPSCEDEDIKIRSGLFGWDSNEEGLCLRTMIIPGPCGLDIGDVESDGLARSKRARSC